MAAAHVLSFVILFALIIRLLLVFCCFSWSLYAVHLCISSGCICQKSIKCLRLWEKENMFVCNMLCNFVTWWYRFAGLVWLDKHGRATNLFDGVENGELEAHKHTDSHCENLLEKPSEKTEKPLLHLLFSLALLTFIWEELCCASRSPEAEQSAAVHQQAKQLGLEPWGSSMANLSKSYSYCQEHNQSIEQHIARIRTNKWANGAC